MKPHRIKTGDININTMPNITSIGQFRTATFTKTEYYIGIDAGTNTGIAIWNKTNKRFEFIKTVKIHQAMEIVKDYVNRGTICVVVEDARLAVHGRNLEAHKAQGAGSIKRDASIWEDFLKDENVPFRMVRPNKTITKLSKETFINITKYTGLTSNHSRDAAMLVYGM